MLLGILSLYFHHHALTGAYTFSIPTLLRAVPQISDSTISLLFWRFFFAFAIKVPMFPFHTWLPDAHVKLPPRVRSFWPAFC